MTQERVTAPPPGQRSTQPVTTQQDRAAWVKRIEDLTFQLMGEQWIVKTYGSVQAWRSSTDYSRVLNGAMREGEAYWTRFSASVLKAAKNTGDSAYWQLPPSQRRTVETGFFQNVDTPDAFGRMKELLDQWGMGAMTDWLWDQLVSGTPESQIFIDLRQHPVYKARFPGMDARANNGLSAISEAEYLLLERSYKSLFRQYGLSQDFFDSPEDMAAFIGFDISPAEMEQRLEIGVERAQRVPDEVKSALRDFYGVDTSQLLGFVLDPTRGIKVLERQFRAAEIGAAGLISGVDVNRERAERLASFGVDFDQAQQGFGAISQEERAATLRPLIGPGLSSEELERAVFLGDQSAIERLRKQQRSALELVERRGGAVTTGEGATGVR